LRLRGLASQELGTKVGFIPCEHSAAVGRLLYPQQSTGRRRGAYDTHSTQRGTPASIAQSVERALESKSSHRVRGNGQVKDWPAPCKLTIDVGRLRGANYGESNVTEAGFKPRLAPIARGGGVAGKSRGCNHGRSCGIRGDPAKLEYPSLPRAT